MKKNALSLVLFETLAAFCGEKHDTFNELVLLG